MSNEVQKDQKDAKIPTPTSLLNPEAQAFVSASISAAIKEAVSGVFASLGPILKDLAMTPEKIRAANTPYVDPAKVARDKRETEKSKQDEKELRAMDAARKAACPHLDQNQRSSIRLIHNYPDRQPRGICPICHDLITPREWRIEAPDAANPKGRAVLTPAHKNYDTVLLLESQSA
jgi:hypothetical protein